MKMEEQTTTMEAIPVVELSRMEMAEAILKMTPAYRAGTVKHRRNGGYIDLYSPDSGTCCFYPTDIIQYFGVFSSYVDYDEQLGKVIVRIY